MDHRWKESRRVPGLYYRFSPAGHLELLGRPTSMGIEAWDQVAEELKREWKIAQAQSDARAARPPTMPEDQLDLFGSARGLCGLKDIPVLKPDRKKSA